MTAFPKAATGTDSFSYFSPRIFQFVFTLAVEQEAEPGDQVVSRLEFHAVPLRQGGHQNAVALHTGEHLLRVAAGSSPSLQYPIPDPWWQPGGRGGNAGTAHGIPQLSSRQENRPNSVKHSFCRCATNPAGRGGFDLTPRTGAGNINGIVVHGERKEYLRPTDREGPPPAVSGPAGSGGKVHPGVGGVMSSVWAALLVYGVKRESGTALSAPLRPAGRWGALCFSLPFLNWNPARKGIPHYAV